MVNEYFDVEIITSEDAKVSLNIGAGNSDWGISNNWEKTHRSTICYFYNLAGAEKLQAGSTVSYPCFALAYSKDGTNRKSNLFTLNVTAINQITSPAINQSDENGDIIIDVEYNKSEPINKMYITCDRNNVLVNWSDDGHWANGEYVPGTDPVLPQTHFILSDLEPGNHRIYIWLDTNAKGWLNAYLTYKFTVPFPVMPGDVTGDGEVNIMDVIRLLKYVSGWGVEVNEAACDVTGDGTINIMDVIRLLKYVSGWDLAIQ